MNPLRRTVHVTAPSRLHFGLLSFGHPGVRQYGGVGAMIEQPGVKIRIGAAAALTIEGAYQERVRDAALRWAGFWRDADLPRCKIELLAAPRMHAGLGVGTQLALAVAAGLNAFHDRTSSSIDALAQSAGRGLRSAVGTYGFATGGLIAEQGKLPAETISPLLDRVALPAAWRFMLVSPTEGEGLHGTVEQTAFDELPPVPTPVTQRLTDILCERLLPAAKTAEFLDFSDAVYDFGYLAGSCFEPVQGGAYNGPALEKLVQDIRALGVRGVGQSSWGPTIFAICDCEASAAALGNQLRAQGGGDFDFMITAPNNDGAQVSVEEAER